MAKETNIRIGWTYYGVVGLNKEWCIMCERARWHESVEQKVCLACCHVTAMEVKETPLEIERFGDCNAATI